jgi:mRNA interferase MazF
MADHRYGDIVLLDYPYSERRASKRRPAIVLLQDRDRDILVARITSKIYEGLSEVVLKDWLEAGLNVPSRVRLSKLAIVGEHDVIRPVGKLTANDRNHLISALNTFVASIE